MKRNIPSVAESRRELRFAGGGPWCPWSCTASACALTRASSGDGRNVGHDVLDGHARVLAQPLDDVAPEPARALAREGRDDDLVDPLVLDHVHRGRVRIGMGDLAVRLDPLGAERRRALRAGAARPRDARPESGRSAGRRSGTRPGPPPPARGSGRAAARRGRSRWRRRGRSPRPVRAATSETTCSTGRSPASRRSSARTFFLRSQPDLSSGWVETISSSTSSSASTSCTAATGPPSNTSPRAGIPAARSAASIRSRRRPAVARREFR